MLIHWIKLLCFCVHKNTKVAVTKAAYNDYVGDPHKLAQIDTSGGVPDVTNNDEDDVFDPYAALGNLDPTDLVQFAGQIACGMVINQTALYLICVMLL